jgi:hypothetical protein
VQVRVKVVNPDALLKPDMNATVSFLSAAKAGTSAPSSVPIIRIPATSVRDGVVFIVENQKALRRPIEFDRVGSELNVRKGLIGGEDLILSPPLTLEDGMKIRVQEGASRG